MKHILMSMLFLSSMAEAQEFLPPIAETPFSTGVINRSTNEPMPFGDWTFDVTIVNPNAREVYCKNTPFVARLASFETGCSNPGYGAYLYANPKDVSGFKIPANGKLSFPEIGYEEREKKNAETGHELTYCGREGWNLECGFSCDNAKNFGDEWTEQINGTGHKKFVCSREGKAVLTEIFCDATHKPGDTWSVAIANGQHNFVCQGDGTIAKDVRCTQNPLYTADASGSCQPASCGSTPHGKRVKTAEDASATYTDVCDFGTWKDRDFECKNGLIKDGFACRAPKSCGTQPHMRRWQEVPACNASCEREVKTFTCTDGKVDSTTKREFCRPTRGLCR